VVQQHTILVITPVLPIRICGVER